MTKPAHTHVYKRSVTLRYDAGLLLGPFYYQSLAERGRTLRNSSYLTRSAIAERGGSITKRGKTLRIPHALLDFGSTDTQGAKCQSVGPGSPGLLHRRDLMGGRTQVHEH